MQIRCRGCGRAFAPRGLSQHLAKTRDARCRQSSVLRDSLSPSLSDRRAPDVDMLGPIQESQDMMLANLVQSRDGMFGDTLSFTGYAIDAYFRNTDPSGPALHEDRYPSDGPSGTNDADANDSTSIDDNPAVDLDVADVTDANTFQELTQGDGETNSSEIAADRPPDNQEEGEETILIESNSTKTTSVVVDVFPFGDPGAPLPGIPQGLSSNARVHATQGDTVWAPFRSERDWFIARWAKTHSTTSTVVAELLAFPEVSVAQHCHKGDSNSGF